MRRWFWYGVTGVAVAAGLAVAAARTLKEILEATDVEWDPLDDVWDDDELTDLMARWNDTVAEMTVEHFTPDDALVDGELPDLVAIGYMVNLESLPSALTGLWKVLTDSSDDLTRTEAVVRGYTLTSQLRVLVAMYETYANLGMERIQEVDDLLPEAHSLLATIDESLRDDD